MNRRLALVPALLLVAVVVLMASPGTGLLPYFSPPRPQAPAPPPSTGPASGPVTAASSFPPHPSITCPNPPPPPAYGMVNGVWPPTPKQSSQAPCSYVAQDGVTGSLFSNAPHSGANFKVPIYLPTVGSKGQEFSYSGVYVGDVLTGDPHSAYRQSFAEAIFTPAPWSGGINYSINVALFSFVNLTFFTTIGSLCPAGIQVSWNYSWFCGIDEMGGGAGASYGQIPGGVWLNVTFDGVKGSSVGTHLWVNS